MAATLCQPATRTTEFALPGDYSEYAFSFTPTCERDRLIASVLPWIARIVREWMRKMQPGERVHYDVDDLIQEGIIALIEKHHCYSKDRGKYTTFTNMVVRQHLSDLRNAAHTITLPRDTPEILTHPESEAASHVRTCMHDFESAECLELESHEDDAADSAHDHELAERKREILKRAVCQFANPLQARVLAWTYGLFGCEPKTPAEIARELGTSLAQVIHTRTQAQLTLTRILADTEIC